MQFNNKILATIFFVLLGIWLLKNVVFTGSSDRSFRSTLMQVDTSTVDLLIFMPKGIDSTSIELNRAGSGWKATKGNIEVDAVADRVQSILGQLTDIPTKRLISKSSERHADYEVTENVGKIIELYSKGKLIEKVIFGRFNFNQNTREATSYARLGDEDDIYSVDGFMSMSFDVDFNSFRDRQLLNVNQADVKALSIINEMGSMVFSMPSQGNWLVNATTPIDSSQMATYLSGLSNVSGNEFNDGFTPQSQPIKSLEITADNSIGNLRIDCFNGGNGFIIKSSSNPGFFVSDS
ncbi:MAG: DUF4340 domain-containing protein, partial [Saprospiraceae bacterium]|nr:DUF4340 domain-containing protein [Saprospiraceae bacterium]